MDVVPGSTIEVLRQGLSSESCGGTVIASSQAALALSLESSAPWDAGEEVYLLRQTPGGRFVSVGEFDRQSGEVTVFRVLAPWRIYNRRLHQRYAANARVMLIAPGADDQDGHIVDISLNGARIAVDSVPEIPPTSVRMAFGGTWTEFACSPRGTIIEGDQVFVRLRFAILTSEQVAAIQRYLKLLEGLDRQNPWSFTA